MQSRPAGLLPQVDSDAEVEHIFKALSEDGQVTMPMQEAFFATRFGQTRKVRYALDAILQQVATKKLDIL